MKRMTGLRISLGLILLGVLLIGFWYFTPVQILVDGSTVSLRSVGLFPGSVLYDAGIALYPGDRISPAPSALYLRTSPIRIQRNTPYNIRVDSQFVTTFSTDPRPANVLGSLGLKLFPGDVLWADGVPITADHSVRPRANHTVQLTRARRATIEGSTIFSAGKTAGEIYWQAGLPAAGYRLAGDPLSQNAGIKLQPPVKVQNSDGTFHTVSYGNTVADAVVNSGWAPQGLDQTSLNLDQPVASETIECSVQRISEELSIQQKSLAFEYQTQLDDTLPLDQKTITQAGEYGIAMQLTRTRYRDGIATDQQVESETVIKPPIPQLTGYGTRIDIQSLDIGSTTIQYYRAVQAYATSYSPCNSGGNTCHNSTASGTTVHKGVIAVSSTWFAYMSGQQVYIPGYGYAVIEDSGGGIPGTNWVDLAYTDEDYQAWHSWVTVYFLTPVPSSILYDLN